MTVGVYILSLSFTITCVTHLIGVLSALHSRSRYLCILSCLLLVPVVVFAGDVNGFVVQEYRTETGEQRKISLTDGSSILLDVESELRIVALGPDTHDVYLNQGRAHFNVVDDPRREFTVYIDACAVSTRSAQFNVRRRPEIIVVSLLEGRVQVESAADTIELDRDAKRSKGKQSRVAHDGAISKPVEEEIANLTSWQRRRLAFQHSPLSEIVEEFNRYNKSPKLRLESEYLRTRSFSGVLNADDPQSLLDYLAADSRIEFDRVGADVIVIRMRSRYGFAKADFSPASPGAASRSRLPSFSWRPPRAANF